MKQKESQCKNTLNDVMLVVDVCDEVETIPTDFVSSCIFENHLFLVFFY